MSNFALLDATDTVVDVLVIEQDIVDTGLFGDPSLYIQTSYNTRGGVHYDAQTGLPSTDQSKALRKNYAGIGFKFDRLRDAFIPKKDFPSWVLNEATCLWEPSVPRPNDGKLYNWDEASVSWKVIEPVWATPVDNAS